MTDEITFKRARNKQNREIRFRQIKEAAVCLFDSMPYHAISLSKIGDIINFTRANLYKYVTSKEDIYLYILLDETYETANELNDNLIMDNLLDTREFSTIWTKTIMKHPRFLKLFSLLYTMIEQNSELESLIEFKNRLFSITASIVRMVRHNFPEFTNTEAMKVIDYATSLIISRYPVCYPSKLQKEAVEKSDHSYEFPDFEETYREGLIFIINGIKLAKF
jgi:AcrR family transcriptional regulator